MCFKAYEAARALNLPLVPKAVLLSLAYRRNSETGFCNPSLETISADTGASLGPIKKAIRLLVKIGVLSYTHGHKGRSNRYRILLDLPQEARSEVTQQLGQIRPTNSQVNLAIYKDVYTREAVATRLDCCEVIDFPVRRSA